MSETVNSEPRSLERCARWWCGVARQDHDEYVTHEFEARLPTCTLGLPSFTFEYYREHFLTYLVQAHGVRMTDRDSDGATGTIDVETDTLVGGTGGNSISPGAFVEHSPAICREGLYQANR